MDVRVELLGPLRLLVDGVPVDVRGPKRRAVLALLAFAEGRTVSVEHLLDALYPAEIPDSGRQALHTHVSRLRAHLGAAADRLTTLQDGYRLDLDGLDVTRARTLLAGARTGDAVDRLREAHALWRGPVLADLLDVGPIAAAVEGCAQLHRDVTDALVEASVAAGAAGAVLDLATASYTADPLREPAVLLLMRALAGTGRAPEALRVGRQYRRALVDETGLDPSSALDGLERDIAGGAVTPAAGPGRPPVPPPAARPATRLVGREEKVAALHRLLAAERLVTLVGPGGVGKTQVALEVARRSDAATVLLLAPVTDPAAVPHALAAALNLTVTRGDVLAACLALLGERPALLVLDNCEHLLAAARDTVEAALAACPALTVLATSREPLGLAAEHRSRLAPLPLPRTGDDLAQVPSVQVFLDRARRVGAAPADLHLVADIVRRLDGMPLAIELAAGRLSTFSLTDLHGRLDRALDLLGGARGDDRHRTLRATVEWSYQLLSAEEQRLFRHLAVFPDGVDLATAERVGADLGLVGDPGSLLARLVDASMVEADLDGTARYRMLETLRAFGVDRLAAAGEQDAAELGLVRWAVEVTGWIGAALLTDGEAGADASLRRELPNLRAAWRTARTRGLLDEAVAIVTALFEVVVNRDLVEIRGWAEELAGDPALDGHPRTGDVLGTAAYAAYHHGDHERADRLARAGLARDGSGSCLHAAAVIALARGAYAEVVELCLRADEDTNRRHYLLGIAALATAYTGDPDGARALNERGLTGGLPPGTRSWSTYFAGEIENVAGRRELAERHYVRAIADGRAAGSTFLVGVATVGLLSVHAASGRTEEALGGYRDVIDYFARTGNWTHLWVALRNLAALLEDLGDDEAAALIRAAADAAPDAPPDPAGPPAGTPVVPRVQVLDVARAAIERQLAGRPCRS
ncbi:MAG: BTAD domain-containing putative transcriptional regulator [Dehalococcoidia bacterium]